MPDEPQSTPLPLCKRCGHQMALARVEPTTEPDHELRFFKCMCGNSDVVKVKCK